MFESDDFDQILSQFDFPDVPDKIHSNDVNESIDKQSTCNTKVNTSLSVQKLPHNSIENENGSLITTEATKIISKSNNISECTKRKIIHSHFNQSSKRKFPGPAGLLSGNLEENKDETICHMELLSQDVDFSQYHLQIDIFESPLWKRLLDDLKDWNVGKIDSIKRIKEQALAGNLRQRKAQAVIAFVEMVDCSATDPLIALRDTTGNIKCTLHRDAWSTFSPYVVSKYCVLVLWKPTVLTTGGAFKKHYLNITLSNIFAIYSSAVLNDETDSASLPNGYVKTSNDDFTIIKTGLNTLNNECLDDSHDLLDDLEDVFSSEMF